MRNDPVGLLMQMSQKSTCPSLILDWSIAKISSQDQQTSGKTICPPPDHPSRGHKKGWLYCYISPYDKQKLTFSFMAMTLVKKSVLVFNYLCTTHVFLLQTLFVRIYGWKQRNNSVQFYLHLLSFCFHVITQNQNVFFSVLSVKSKIFFIQYNSMFLNPFPTQSPKIKSLFPVQKPHQSSEIFLLMSRLHLAKGTTSISDCTSSTTTLEYNKHSGGQSQSTVYKYNTYVKVMVDIGKLSPEIMSQV